MADSNIIRAGKLAQKEPSELVIDGAPMNPEGQEYAAVAVVADQSKIKKKSQVPAICAINMLGAFPTEEACKAYIQKLQKVGYNYFDIFIVKMNHFVALPPPRIAADTVYHQHILKDLMRRHMETIKVSENKIDARLEVSRAEQRIMEEVKTSARRERLKKKLAEKRGPDPVESVTLESGGPPPGANIAAPVIFKVAECELKKKTSENPQSASS